MPLNAPKAYTFKPSPTGAVKLTSRSSVRARLTAGGSYWRAKEYGERGNLIHLTVVEDLTLPTPEGMFVEQHKGFKADEMVAVTGMSMPPHKLYDLNLAWNEELRFRKVNGRLVCERYGIRWQIAGGETLIASWDVLPGKVFMQPNLVTVKIDLLPGDWPDDAVFYLRPRTHRIPLVPPSAPESEPTMTLTGWNIGVLRTTLNGLESAWTRMPERGTPADPNTPGSTASAGEDKQDEGADAVSLSAFELTPLKGGNGLPAYPVGLNTGPDRVLVHLNYAEREDGSMGEFNAVFEWVGSSSKDGTWQRYS